MPEAHGLHGRYRDVVRDAAGRVVHDSGVRPNVIVQDCRRLLAAFMHGGPASEGVIGLQVGRGDPNWDQTGSPPADPARTALVDPEPFTLQAADLTFDFLLGDVSAAQPTDTLRIAGVFGPNQPPWPDANHTDTNLREFGLVGRLNGVVTLINHVIHPVIAKDPVAPLERTIWLRF